MANGKYLFPGHKEPLTRKQWLGFDDTGIPDIRISKPFATVKPLTKGVRKEIITTLSKGKVR